MGTLLTLSKTATPRSSTVARRFWWLVAVILFLAVASSAYAVRLVALPFLENYQRDAVSVQARKTALSLEAHLANRRQLMTLVARDPQVVNIALGYTNRADYLIDLLDSLPISPELSWVTMFDAFGETLANYDIRGDDRNRVSGDALASLLNDLLEGVYRPDQRVVLGKKDNFSYIVIPVPVRNGDYVEGWILAGYRFDVEAVFGSNEIAQDTYLVPWYTKAPGGQTVVVPLDKFALNIVMVPDQQVVSAAGRALLGNSVAALAGVLFVAFGVFGLLGKKVIVDPHRRLERQTVELAKQKSDLARLAAIAQKANDTFILTDLDRRVEWANPALERLCGYRLQDIRGKRPGDFLYGPETDPDTVAAIQRALDSRTPLQCELLSYRKNGTAYWSHLSISPLSTEQGEVYGFMSIANDVTERKRQQQALIDAKNETEHQALHDALTGLPNRRALDAALKSRQASQTDVSTLVRIDLDHFKYVNDTMGHEAGDFVLCEVARSLRDEIDKGDVAARVGGDEFVVLLHPDATEQDGLVLAERILSRIQSPRMFENKTIRIGGSFGVASTSSDLAQLRDLSIAADAALYEAKEAGRNRAHLYTPELHAAVIARRDLARTLRQAVAREEFVPYFQPQFDSKSFEIVGVETLVRWHSPELGLLLPQQFLPIAQQLSIVEEIDEIVLRKALSDLKILRDQGVDIPKLSLNVTAERIQRPELANALKNMSPGGPVIAFEVLETVLVEEQSDLFHFSLDQLRALGARIEIDDFGSGHASVVGLLQLQPDAMKIDKRLVLPMLEDSVSHSLLRNIVQMGMTMDLEIIAEGVETMEHAEALRDAGCHVLQGYAFCRAMLRDDLSGFVKQRAWLHGSNRAAS